MMEWIKKHDVVAKAASLLFAFFLWLFVISSQGMEMTKTFSRVAVDLKGIDSLTANNLVMTSGSQSAVTFKVTGSSDRIAMLIDNDGLSVTADLSSITEPGEYDVRYQVTSTVSEVTISKVTPSIKIVVDRLISKSFPIDLTLTGILQDGYVFDSYALTPDAVTVTGPEHVLETIVSAPASFDISDVRSTVTSTLAYTLLGADGAEVRSSQIHVDTPSIKLTYSVRQRGEIPLMLDVSDYGFINDSMVDIELSPATVKVSGAPDVVSTLNRIDLGTVSLEQVFEESRYELTMPLVLPNGVTSDDGVTSVKVTIRPTEVVKANIELPRDVLPASEDFTYASDLIVTVWTTDLKAPSLGPDSIDLTLSYDASELAVGLNELPVRVTPLERQMIVIGEYTVVVEVPEKEE